MKNCPFCKKQLPDEMQFCPYCMSKFVQETSIQPTVTLQPKKSNKKLIIIISILFILLIIAGVAVFLFIGGKDDKPISESTTAPSSTTAETTTESVTATEPSNPTETDIQTTAQSGIQNPTQTTAQRPTLTPARNYSDYIGTWYGVSNTTDNTDGQYAITLNIVHADTLNISGTISVYHSVVRETATVNFSGELDKGLLYYEYDDDGVGNAGYIYIRLDENEIRVANGFIGWNNNSLFHWNSGGSDFILTR